MFEVHVRRTTPRVPRFRTIVMETDGARLADGSRSVLSVPEKPGNQFQE